MIKIIRTCLATLACFALVGLVNAQKVSNKNLITQNSVGGVEIGMTVSQARQILKGFTLERTSDGEGIALIGARNGEQEYSMTFYAGEEDPEAKINEKAKIEMIEVWFANYKTASGIHPRMELSKVEQKYGKVKEITKSEIESREYVKFARHPKGIEYRVTGDGKDAGVYSGSPRKTSRYTQGAYIQSVIVLGNKMNSGEKVKFTSSYTELSKCKSEGGENGGHVSITCNGPGGYRIESFDSAMFLHFRVVSNSFSKNLATQTFKFDSKKRKAEWRMANGKPFALIVRFNEVVVDDRTGSASEGAGEYLLVKGLQGFEHINFTVDARKVRSANSEARKLADLAFRR